MGQHACVPQTQPVHLITEQNKVIFQEQNGNLKVFPSIAAGKMKDVVYASFVHIILAKLGQANAGIDNKWDIVTW